jgi:hypothetical protein
MFVNAVSTQTEGNLMMSLDYDTLDAAPANLVQASQLAKYKVSPLYCPCEFSIPVNHPGNSPWLYTFDLSATTNTVDLKTYNLGNFFLSLDGVLQDGKDYGYLAVEYDVELLDKNPVIDTFASKTWDSSAPISKKARSNVDPADTMEVTATAERTATSENVAISCDAPIGSKVRCNFVLFSDGTDFAGWEPASGEILNRETITTNNGYTVSIMAVGGEVDTDSKFFVASRLAGDVVGQQPAIKMAMAYTYA